MEEPELKRKPTTKAGKLRAAAGRLIHATRNQMQEDDEEQPGVTMLGEALTLLALAEEDEYDAGAN